MNLNDIPTFKRLDPQDMYRHIEELPDQLQNAWTLGQHLSLPDWKGINRVLISGMGGSAIGADLFTSYVHSLSPVPIFVHRNYGLPAWARGPETLVISSSHSGNTEETLVTFRDAAEKGCRLLSISTGGKLADEAEKAGTTLWQFEHTGQPRAAVGYSFGLLLAAFTRLNLIPNPGDELSLAVSAMREQQEGLRAEVPVQQNTAKRLAGQLVGRWVTVMGSDIMEPVARRWKGQISEIAKAWAQFEFLPEANHNTLAGTQNPENLLSQMMVLFLRSGSDHPRNRTRSELTQRAFMLEGMNTDAFEAQGSTPLAHLWTALHFGDYLAYYLAMAYQEDPTPVRALEGFKKELASYS